MNPAQMVKRAQRDPVCEIVRAARGAEHDVVILQVLQRPLQPSKSLVGAAGFEPATF